ncbi:MAG TPA: hypothetical protein VKT22_10270 [Steroidobacteraceae bacterium]|nr:hypothetical protein [Steroidobacteraceae bacterium]
MLGAPLLAVSFLCARTDAAPGASRPAAPVCTIGPLRLTPLPLIPVAINERGEVLGNDTGRRAALLRPQGRLEELPLPSGFEHSEAVALNANGTAVAIADDAAHSRHLAYVVSEGRLKTLAGGAARPFRIDDAGLVVGEAVVVDGSRSEPVLWNTAGAASPVAPRPLGGCCGGTAKVLDGRGTIAGDAYDEAGRYHAFRWREGSGLERIDPQDGFSSSLAMNRSGHVLIIAFPKILLASAQGLEPLKLSPKGHSHPHALNDCDVVVGDSGPFADAARAFAWDRTQGFIDLNTLIEPGSGLTLKSALDLNNRGEIVGRAEAPREIVRGFLLQPTHPLDGS